MTTFNFVLSPAICAKKIAKIAKVGSALQAEIHSVGVSVLDHIREHGDYTLATRLLGALPNGQRVKALAAWFREFSGGAAVFSYDASNQCWKCKLDPNRTDEQFRIEEANRVSFADLNPEKGYSTLTLKGFMGYLKRKANEDGTNPDGSVKVEPAVREAAALFYGNLKSAMGGVKTPALDDLVADEA